MTVSNRLKAAFLVAAVAVAGTELTNALTVSDSFSLIAPAEARVGRPLTPVSVAGVARRTTRRCAAGVYNC